MECETATIYELEVKSYTSRSDGLRTFGLIAEEVYEAAPDLVNLDKKGRPDSIREPLLAYMMLEELKVANSLAVNTVLKKELSQVLKNQLSLLMTKRLRIIQPLPQLKKYKN